MENLTWKLLNSSVLRKLEMYGQVLGGLYFPEGKGRPGGGGGVG